MELSKLRLQNPQWDSVELFFSDPLLKQLAQLKLILRFPLEKKIRPEPGRLYILRGPRQIGKTTLLKRIIKSLLEEGIEPQRIFYFALDIGGIKKEEELFDLLLTYHEFASERYSKPFFIFLDEATYASDWAIGVKKAYDLGIIRDCFLIITASSSIELKRGGERLPGRRGILPHESDVEMLPLSFREFVQNLAPQIQIPTVDISPEEIYRAAEELSYFSQELKNLMGKFLLTGGFPLSINELLAKGEISPGPYITYLQAILADLARAGKSEAYFKEIIYIIIQKKLEPLDSALIAKETSIGSHNTVSSYIETLKGFFLLDVVYSARNIRDPRPSFRKRRKFYFKDPFLFHLMAAWAEGDYNFFRFSRKLMESEMAGRVVENTVGSHLKRKGNVYHWRGKKGEIDFLFGKKPVFIEVKYQPRIFSDDLRVLKRAGGGLLISRETFEMRENICIVPLHLFLPLI